MNRRLHKSIALLLSGAGLAAVPLVAGAIVEGVTFRDGRTVKSVSNVGTTSVSAEIPVYAWDGNNATTTLSVFGGSPKFLGWAHNVHWFDIAITKPGNFKISLVRANPQQTNFHPAFTLWPVDASRPFDFGNCLDAGGCGNVAGTHNFNQVAGPTLTNSNAWMLGPTGPDTDPDGKPLGEPANPRTLKWTPANGRAAVTGFIGYANSGTGGPGADAWKTGLPRNMTGGRFNKDTSPLFSFGTDQNDVLQGGRVNTDRGGGLGGSTLDPRSNVDAPLHQGAAAMNLYGLAAGHYLIALGGSCVKADCGAGSASYRLEVTEITGLPEARATANSPVRAGATVTLDGGSSISADGGKPKTYLWSQTGGPSVTLAPGGSSPTQSFTAPEAAIGQPLSFELRVDDGKVQSDPAVVTVAINSDNNAPTVRTAPVAVLEGALVRITPTVEDSDRDGIASYRWEQTQGPMVLLDNPNGRDISFTAPSVGNAAEPLVLSFNLTVTDDYGFNPKSTTVPVPVSVSRDPLKLDCSRATASPASLWPPNRQMKPVTINGISSPGNAPYSLTINSVMQDEPVQDRAAKDRTGPDAQIRRGKATRKKPLKVDRVLLRAERQTRQRNGAGSDNGRVYWVGFGAATADGQSCTGAVKVEVPPASGGNAMDDGPSHDSTRRK